MDKISPIAFGINKLTTGMDDKLIQQLFERAHFGKRHVVVNGRFNAFIQILMARYAGHLSQQIPLALALYRFKSAANTGSTQINQVRQIALQITPHFVTNIQMHRLQNRLSQTESMAFKVINVKTALKSTNSDILGEQVSPSENSLMHITTPDVWRKEQPSNNIKQPPAPATKQYFSINHFYRHQEAHRFVDTVMMRFQTQLLQRIAQQQKRRELSTQRPGTTAVPVRSRAPGATAAPINSPVPPLPPAPRVLRRQSTVLVDQTLNGRAANEMQRSSNRSFPHQSPVETAVDVHRLTDQVVRTIDQRLIAYRERMGSV